MNTVRLYFGIIRDTIISFPRLFVIHNLTLLETCDEGDGTKTFIFKSNRKLKYLPGQYGIWMQKRWINGKPFRLFTVASAPEESVIQLTTYISETDFKQKLNKLKVGEKMLMIGPIGQFTLSKKIPQKTIFIAGGIGVTPVRSISRYIFDQSLKTKTTLIHSSRENYLFKDELIKYIDCTYFTTRDELVGIINAVINISSDTTFFISGPPKFVESTRKILKQRNIRHIKTDGFLGY